MNALKEDTEKKIIQAAKEVFIEKGLQGARMQEIADRAGINKALLHYYFRSKDKMFDAVFQDIIHGLIPEFSKMVSPDMPVFELMRNFVEFYNKFFTENPFLPQFFFHEIWQHPDKLASFIRSQEIDPKELASRVQGQMPQIDDTQFLPQHMFANILGMTLFPHIARPLFQRLLFNNSDEEYNKFLAERSDFLLKMMSSVFEPGQKLSDENPDDDF